MLLQWGTSHHVISSAVYGIKWAHDMNGFADPTDNAFVRNLHECTKRTGRKTVKKDDVTPEMLIELCNKHEDNNDLLINRNL